MSQLILTLNTAVEPFGYAIFKGSLCVVNTQKHASKRFTETLLDQIVHELSLAGLALDKLTAVGVVEGPGSYTGIRVGLSYAKTIAYTVGCPIFSFKSLECIADAAINHNSFLASVAPSKPGFIYFQLFSDYKSELAEPATDLLHINENEFENIIQSFNAPLQITGIINGSFEEKVNTSKNCKYTNQVIDCKTIAKRVFKQLDTGKHSTIFKVNPFYFHDPKIGIIKQRSLDKTKKGNQL